MSTLSKTCGFILGMLVPILICLCICFMKIPKPLREEFKKDKKKEFFKRDQKGFKKFH